MGDFSGKRARYACCAAAFARREGVEGVRLGGIPRWGWEGPAPQETPPLGEVARAARGGGSTKKAAPAATRYRAPARSPPSDPPAAGHLPRGGDSFLALVLRP